MYDNEQYERLNRYEKDSLSYAISLVGVTDLITGYSLNLVYKF